MPVRPENRGRYPADWPLISQRIRLGRAANRCECRGECGTPHDRPPWDLDDADPPRCDSWGGDLTVSERTGREYVVVLTVAHLDHVPEHCEDANLRAMCQPCHLRYDADHHAATRAATRAAQLEAAGQGRLA